MKKLLLLVLTALSVHAMQAQEFDEDEGKPLAFKFAPASLSIGKATLAMEYNFKSRNSVTLVIGVPTGKDKQVNYDGQQSDLHSKAISLMAGYRHYLGQKHMKGFYVEPYVKYLKHEATGIINAQLSSGTMMFDSKSSYSGIGLGAQFGVQMIISRSIVLDLYFLGFEVNSSKHNYTGKDISNNLYWTVADEQKVEADMRDLLANIPIVGNSIEPKVDANTRTITTDYSGILPGIRIGGSIGIRF